MTVPLTLRPYQQAAIERARAALRAGRRRLVIVAPTGAGKTVIAARIVSSARERSRRVIFVAHRRELITQTFRKLRDAGIPEHEIGVLMGDDERSRPDAPVQVVSIATYVRREPPPADLVIVDECHRSLSPSYLALIERYSSAGAVVVGLTATPFRANGDGLGDVFEELVLVARPLDLIAEGFLVEPRVFSGGAPDLEGVHTRGGDYVESELQDAMNDTALVGGIVEHWMRLAERRRTVAFAAGVEHSRAIVAAFVEAGIPAEHLDGTTPKDERDAILARLDSAETLVVSNCGVLCEGWDMPACKALILARPTKSLGLYMQQAGRVLRPWNGVTPIILDHAGNALRHGLPQDDRDFSLDGSKASGSGPTRECPECSAVVALGAVQCPECGHAFERAAPERELSVEAPGELRELHRTGAVPASAGQLDALRRAGYPKRELQNLSARDASRLLNAITQRRQQGLCTLKQARALQRYGRPHNVSFEEARAMLDEIARRGWKLARRSSAAMSGTDGEC